MRKHIACLFFFSALAACGSSQKSEPYCGDHAIDPGEECEPGNLGGKSCADFGFAGGALECTDQCRFDTSRCQEANTCGNDLVEAGEECEPKLALGFGCEKLGFSGGQLACTSKCLIDASGCSGCEDDPSEENDSAAAARALAEGNNRFVLCNRGGEEDWFSVNVAAGQRVYLKLEQEPVTDIDLELFDEAGTLLAASASGFLAEEIDHTASAAGRLLVRVFAYADFPGAVGYDLDLALDPQCRDGRDCPSGSLCRSYQCVETACSDQNPCPDELVCLQGRCLECADSGDCPEADAYLCQQNTCVYSCQEDSLEPNSASGQAVSITLPFQQALSLCGPSDSDWFSVRLEARRLYRVELSFSYSQGDVDLDVYKSSALDRPVAMSHTESDGERIELAVKNAYDYLIAVSLGYEQLAQNYTLSVSDLGPAECVEDQDCPAGSMCSGYHCAAVECEIDTDCQSPERCLQGACVSAPDGDECQSAMVIGQLPFVYEAGQWGAYRNHVEFAPGDCTADGTPGYDAIFSLSLQAGQTIRARVAGDQDVALILAAECGAALSASACLAGADEGLAGEEEEIVYTADSARQVYVIVDSYSTGYPDRGNFRLEVTAE